MPSSIPQLQHKDARGTDSVFGITALYLHHFRNFKSLHLALAPSPIVLTAPNGSGKTNILEALSLFSPGKGLRSARFSTMQQQGQPHPWQVGMTVMDGGIDMTFGTILASDGSLDKRIVKYQGEVLKTQASLTDYLNIVWFTPSMGTLLSEGGQIQRQFVDRLVFSHDAAHAKRRSTYDRLLRERNALLKEHGPRTHTSWLDALEAQLAELGHDIMSSRGSVLHTVQHLQSTAPLFPQFTAVMTGEAETLHQYIQPRTACIQALQGHYHKSRDLDALKGSTSMGPHRAKLQVMHCGKQMPAEFCSTGEQKMLVLAIILAFVKMASFQGLALLLDDVVDHLDEQHRSVLLGDVMALCASQKAQVWMTGSDAKAFDSIQQRAMFVPLM